MTERGTPGLPWYEQSRHNFIGGEWRAAPDGRSFDVLDPADSSVVAAVPLSSHRDIDAAMEAAQAAIGHWTALPGDRRAAIVDDALASMADRINRISAIVSRDTGLPPKAARNDILAAIRETRAILAGTAGPPDEGAPGTIGQLLSWSNPLALCIRTLAVDLAAGNTAVVRPSIRAPLSPVFLADALDRAGLPGGVFNLVQGTGTDAGMALARRPDLKRLDFQGSGATADALAPSPGGNETPVSRHLRSVAHCQVDAGDELEDAARDIAELASCHAARAGHGGLLVTVARSRLKGFSEAIEAAFQGSRYYEPQCGSHTIAPFIAEGFRSAYERSIEGHLASGAECVFATPPPDPKIPGIGWFAPVYVLHDPAHRISLDPDLPNGPLVLLRSE